MIDTRPSSSPPPGPSQGPSSEPAPSDKPRWRLLAYIPLVLVVALSGLFAVSLFQGDPQTLPSARIGKAVLPFSVPRLQSDERLTEADLATGTPILLNVWASWCGPCRDEHPFLAALQAQGVEIIGLNYKDKPDAARRFLQRLGDPYSKIGVDASGRVAIDLGVYGVPETFILDAQGRVLDRHVGPLDEAAINQKIGTYFNLRPEGFASSQPND